MKKSVLVAGLLLVLIALPWFWAFQSFLSASGCLGRENGRTLRFVYVDKTHFDAYRTAVWFDDSLTVTGEDGRIVCNGKLIDFPDDKNTALVRSPGNIIFVRLDDRYFKEEPGSSEIYFMLGKVPKFKKSEKGMINLDKLKRDGIIETEWKAFLGNEQPDKTQNNR